MRLRWWALAAALGVLAALALPDFDPAWRWKMKCSNGKAVWVWKVCR